MAASFAGGLKFFESGNIRMGLALTLIAPSVIFGTRYVYQKYFQKNLGLIFLAEIEALVFTSMSLMILGEIFFYENIPTFDTFVHFANGVLITILVVVLNYQRWLEEKLTPTLAVLIAGLAPVLLGEIYELSSDAILGTRLWGDIFWANLKPLWLDTTSDVLIQVLGSMLAVLILKRYLPLWLNRWKN